MSGCVDELEPLMMTRKKVEQLPVVEPQEQGLVLVQPGQAGLNEPDRHQLPKDTHCHLDRKTRPELHLRMRKKCQFKASSREAGENRGKLE